jgi:hypothetical protein
MFKHRHRRRLPTAALIASLLLAAPLTATAQDAGPEPAPAAVLDAGTVAATPTPDTPPVIVDPGAGTVTPTEGTPAADATAHPGSTAEQMLRDVRGGNWRMAIAGALALLMVAGVRWGGRLFGSTDRGKSIAVMLLAMMGTLSTALATSTPLSVGVFTGAVALAFTAVGGRKWLSSILWPRDGGGAWAAWLKPWLGVDQPPPK